MTTWRAYITTWTSACGVRHGRYSFCGFAGRESAVTLGATIPWTLPDYVQERRVDPPNQTVRKSALRRVRKLRNDGKSEGSICARLSRKGRSRAVSQPLGDRSGPNN